MDRPLEYAFSSLLVAGYLKEMYSIKGLNRIYLIIHEIGVK